MSLPLTPSLSQNNHSSNNDNQAKIEVAHEQCLNAETIDTQNQTETNEFSQIKKSQSLQQKVNKRKSKDIVLLKEQNDDDAFQIGDESGDASLGVRCGILQMREIFISLRQQIQKAFNEQEISVDLCRLLPENLVDDYYEMMSYIKQRIQSIKNHNEISFVLAEPGYEIEQDSLQLPELTNDDALLKIMEQKDTLIASLMNEKTEQENTINQLTLQREELEDENQNRFMNQCNLYKKQIKELKKQIDELQMNLNSMKNVIRNVMEAYSSDEDLQDDFRDSMMVYSKVVKLSEKEQIRVKYYIDKYLEMKEIS